ncbi:LCP family protein, partial [Clostridium sp.]|uniref:LCP family protein n=1 Tax=Clostridium sp. TaxID=1506 RepID=UPI0026097D9F
MANRENENRKSSAIDDRKRAKRIEVMKKRKRKKRKRIFAFTISLIIALFLGTFAYGYNFISSLKTNSLGTGIKPQSKTDPINILVLGMDVGDAENQENKAGRRTDTIMVFNYNPNTKKSHLVSVPRDTLIEVDALESGQYQRYWKINAAYALGEEEEVTMHVENLLGININYIVEVDYNAFRKSIDAIGGVDMYIEQDMFYDDDEQNLHINFKGGETV